MNLSYPLSEVECTNLSSDRKEIINSINNLREQLVKFGYNQQEVDYIARKYAGAAMAELKVHDLKKLETALKQHLDMAKKCLNVR